MRGRRASGRIAGDRKRGWYGLRMSFCDATQLKRCLRSKNPETLLYRFPVVLVEKFL
jgi:hypothetical protein